MAEHNWQDSSREFFDLRASQTRDVDLGTLCFVSGRDPRLWSDPEMYKDLIDSIVFQAKVDKDSSLLEVGCASGFLAWGLAPRLRDYIGLDVASRAVKAAQRLKLANTKFQVANGSNLPLQANQLDAAICYDVFTNFPDFDFGAGIITEMLRVVRPGKRVLIGSIPDAKMRTGYEQRVMEVAERLHERYGPPETGPDCSRPPDLLSRIRNWIHPKEAKITCYYFKREDFLRLGDALDVSVELVDIHPLNPYCGYRFNAIFTKNA